MATLLRRSILPLAVLALAVALVPVALTAPMVAQSETHLSWAYRLRQIDFPLALVTLVAAVAIAIGTWRGGTKLLGRIGLVLAVIVAGGAVRFSTHNMLASMFEPLAASRYVPIGEAGHVDDEDLILGIEAGGERLIYPIGIIGYHHILNERLKGEPFVVTY